MTRLVHSRAARRGFTLVELMVALTGGLFISVFVFMLASHGSRFYQQEARISNATIGVMNGFQRLRADIARAAFLASPNIAKDPLLCSENEPAVGLGDATPMLDNLAGVRLLIGGSRDAASGDLASFWDATGLDPDQLILAGSYVSADQFPAAEVVQLNSSSNVWTVFLQPNSPALARLGYRTDSSQDDQARIALLRSVFTPDEGARVLRILDRKGSHHYGVIDSVGLTDMDGQQAPFIQLTDGVPLVRETRANTCGLSGLNVGATVNVVNFIRYGLGRLDSASTGNNTYDAIYDTDNEGTGEETRAELVRVELDVNGNAIEGTTELVAEYAVDLKFGLTVLQNAGLTTFDETDSADDLLQFAGPPSTGPAAALNRGPHLIRSVRARLAVRSREGDREGDIDAEAAGIPEGLYRIGLGPEGGAPFARVRTLQADIALRNNARGRWQ